MPNSFSGESELLSRREREKLAHRQAILDAAVRLFSEKGYFNTTLDEVAQRAEFSKGTLYLYFSSKEDMLFTIFHEEFIKWRNFITEITGKDMPFKDEVKEIFKIGAEYAYDDTFNFNINLLHRNPSIKALSPVRVEELQKMHDELEHLSVLRIERAVEEGEIRAINARALFGLLHGSLESIFETRWGTISLDELKKAVDTIIDIIFNGIAKEREIAQ